MRRTVAVGYLGEGRKEEGGCSEGLHLGKGSGAGDLGPETSLSTDYSGCGVDTRSLNRASFPPLYTTLACVRVAQSAHTTIFIAATP